MHSADATSGVAWEGAERRLIGVMNRLGALQVGSLLCRYKVVAGTSLAQLLLFLLPLWGPPSPLPTATRADAALSRGWGGWAAASFSE